MSALAVLLLALAVVLAVVILREGRRIDAAIDEILDAPTQPEPRGGIVRQCQGPCRRRIYTPGPLLSLSPWWCNRCVDQAIANYEREMSS